MCWQIELDLGSGPLAPRLARSLVGEHLGAKLAGAGHADICDDAGLVASELVTNAIVAGAKQVRLALRLHRHELTIAVTDDGAGWPAEQQINTTAAHGRGLSIVAVLSQRWGVERISSDSKQVWASLCVPESLTRALDCLHPLT